ncbi:B3 domain-containing protein [Hordeum vulgare]|nr:B3 domain-containing protein [Hordeum vulgare]
MKEETALGFEFFLVVLPNSLKKMRLPDKFARLLDGRRPRELKLREAGRQGLLWVTDVVFDADGHMYLGRGWEQFARAHDLRLGHFLILSYDGHTVLTVKVFDGSMCRRDYQHHDDTFSGSSSASGNTLGVSKMSNPCDSDGSQNERSYSSEELSAEDSLSVDNSVESANLQKLSNNYALSSHCRLTKAQKMKINAVLKKIKPKFKMLVVQMKKSNIRRYTLEIPKDYALKHFPCEDTSITLQLPRKNKNWKCKLYVRPSGVAGSGRCSLYVGKFVHDTHVREGDIYLFQPMTNVKQRRYVMTAHPLHEAYSDHSAGGRTNIGSNHRTCAKMGDVKDKTPTDGEEYSSKHEELEVSQDSEETLFMLDDGAYLTPAQEMKSLEKVEEIKFKPPFYVAIMSKSTVSQRGSQNNPMLRFGSQYTAKYFVEKFAVSHDRGKHSGIYLLLRLEGKIRSWPTKLQHSSRGSKVLKGWPSFARDNRLREGDLCLFKLMKNEEPLMMMVYIVRR